MTSFAIMNDCHCSGSPLKLVNDNTAIDDEGPLPAVADHTGGPDGGKAALDALFGHRMWFLKGPHPAILYERPDGESIAPHFRNGSN